MHMCINIAWRSKNYCKLAKQLDTYIYRMEFTKEQNNQLKQIKDMVRLKNLQTKCEEFKEKLEGLITERSECVTKREVLIESVTSLQEEYKNARNEEFALQQKLEAAKNSCVDYKNDYLESICEILGYQNLECQLLENNGLQVTLNYRDVCHVTYSEIDQTFDLIEIFPQYFDFPKIQQFLHSSQDLRGLLACLRKFFDLALEYKEKESKQKQEQINNE